MDYNNKYIEKYTISKLNLTIILIQERNNLFNIYYNKDGSIEISYRKPFYISKLNRIHLANDECIIFELPRDVHILSISKIRKQKTKLVIYNDRNFCVGYNEKLIPTVELMEELPEIIVKPWVKPRYTLPEIPPDFNFDDDLDLNL